MDSQRLRSFGHPGRAATLLALGLASAVAADARPDRATGFEPAWRSAVERYAANAPFYPSRARYRIEELEPSGEVGSLETGELAIARGLDAAIRLEVLRASKDGADVTARRRVLGFSGLPGLPAAGDRAAPGSPFGNPVPFSAASRDAVALGEGRRLESGGFEQDYSILHKSPVLGRVRFGLDGAPLGLEYELGSPPFPVSRLAGQVELREGPRGCLIATEHRIEGEMELLGLKRRYRFQLAFSDWREFR